MILTRRTMFAGLAATIAAPAIIRTPGLLMPIKPVRYAQFLKIFDDKLNAAYEYLIQQSEDGVLWGDLKPVPKDTLVTVQHRFMRLVANVAEPAQPNFSIGVHRA